MSRIALFGAGVVWLAASCAASADERFSKQRGQTAGDIVRESLKRYLAVERFQALRGKTLPFAEAQGFLTDEDVFKALS